MSISSQGSRDAIVKFIKDNHDRLDYNAQIFCILEGSLKELLDKRMLVDLGPKSAGAASSRTAPINVLKKIIEKLTVIYSQNVVRTVEGGNDADQELLAWYEETLNLNSKMSTNNGFFNTFLYSMLQISLKNINPLTQAGTPFVRSIPNHQFLVMSMDPIDPTSPDIVILCMPKVRDEAGAEQEIFYVFSKDEFMIINGAGIIQDKMMTQQNQDGTNPYGALPFNYVNASENLIMPMVQTDNLDMALLIPLLLTDLNYAVKFQAFSVFVGIDIDTKTVEFSPNSILSFKSETNAEGETKPSFDVVKPTVDIAETLSLASSQMSLWLTTKGVRPGTIGQLGTDQFASGVSKIVDESDTYESVKKQIGIYKKAEKDFWDLLLKTIHPFWADAGRVSNVHKFTPEAKVITTFAEPKPMQSRKDLVDELIAEVEAGFTTVKMAVKKLYPTLPEEELDALIKEAEGTRAERAKPPIQVPTGTVPLLNAG